MKKEYSVPVVEKVDFDYKIQTTESTCIESVMNQNPTATNACTEGTRVSLGWNNDQTVV